MRIADRITRLERRDTTDDRMTPDEIANATERFDQLLADDLLPAGAIVDQARQGWRSLVAAPGPGYMQRVFANMHPADLYV